MTRTGLDALIEETTVDAYNEHEQITDPVEDRRSSRLAFGSLVGLLNTEDRERSSIFSAAADALQAYTSDGALMTASDPNFDRLRSSPARTPCTSTRRRRSRPPSHPVVSGLLAEVRRATYRAHAAGHLSAGVLFALDEVANIPPLQELPQIASEAGGQGLTLLAAFQDLSQPRARWGMAADGFLTLFGTKLLLPGIADTTTLGGGVDDARRVRPAGDFANQRREPVVTRARRPGRSRPSARASSPQARSPESRGRRPAPRRGR